MMMPVPCNSIRCRAVDGEMLISVVAPLIFSINSSCSDDKDNGAENPCNPLQDTGSIDQAIVRRGEIEAVHVKDVTLPDLAETRAR
jgi:hypothetical protein